MDISSLFQQLGIALGLGLLVGLQRESAASPLAGDLHPGLQNLRAVVFFDITRKVARTHTWNLKSFLDHR